ncbi:hypothetical protein Tco_0984135 [Tanacetum coccineum]
MDEILKKFGFLTVKTASTPIETSKSLMNDENAEDVDVHLYRSMIGSLMYLTSLRPDIMFVVCAFARFQVTPKVSYLHVVKRIFRYLEGNPQQEIDNWNRLEMLRMKLGLKLCCQAKVNAARLLTTARLPLELQLLRVFFDYKTDANDEPMMPNLEDTGIFGDAYDDEDLLLQEET